MLEVLCESKREHDADFPSCPWVFHNNGDPIVRFDEAWKSACKRAKVPDLLFHDLRRTAARDLRRAGNSEEIIMKIGGWKTPSMFKRYAIVSPADMEQAIGKLELERERVAAEINHDFDHDSEISSADGGKTKTARVN